MSGGPDSLVLIFLRRMDAKLDRIGDDVTELKQRVGAAGDPVCLAVKPGRRDG